MYTENIHQSLVVNCDQTEVILIPTGSDHTYNPRGSKQVELYGKEEKRAFTSLITTSIDGGMLPTQSVWSGKTARYLPSIMFRAPAEDEGHLFSFNRKNHWSCLSTMKVYFEILIKPYRNRMLAKHELPINAKMVVYFDCWKVHKSRALLEWLKATYPWLIALFVPAGCTGILQPCDVGIQRIYKHHIKLAAAQYFQETVQAQLQSGIRPADIRIMDNIGKLRNQTATWVLAATRYLQDPARKGLVQNAWKNCRINHYGLSWECITSKESIRALLVESKDVRMRVIGITEVALGEESDLVVDNDIDEDGDDVPLDVVALAKNMPSTMEIKALLDNEGTISRAYMGGSLPTGYTRSTHPSYNGGIQREAQLDTDNKSGDDEEVEEWDMGGMDSTASRASAQSTSS